MSRLPKLHALRVAAEAAAYEQEAAVLRAAHEAECAIVRKLNADIQRYCTHLQTPLQPFQTVSTHCLLLQICHAVSFYASPHAKVDSLPVSYVFTVYCVYCLPTE